MPRSTRSRRKEAHYVRMQQSINARYSANDIDTVREIINQRQLAQKKKLDEKSRRIQLRKLEELRMKENQLKCEQNRIKKEMQQQEAKTRLENALNDNENYKKWIDLQNQSNILHDQFETLDEKYSKAKRKLGYIMYKHITKAPKDENGLNWGSHVATLRAVIGWGYDNGNHSEVLGLLKSIFNYSSRCRCEDRKGWLGQMERLVPQWSKILKESSGQSHNIISAKKLFNMISIDVDFDKVYDSMKDGIEYVESTQAEYSTSIKETQKELDNLKIAIMKCKNEIHEVSVKGTKVSDGFAHLLNQWVQEVGSRHIASYPLRCVDIFYRI